MSDAATAKAYWTVRDLAARYHVSPDTIRQWIAKGALVAARLGPGVKPRVRVTDQERRRFEADVSTDA
jgi:DNA-binding transcriptional MerR regulator